MTCGKKDIIPSSYLAFRLLTNTSEKTVTTTMIRKPTAVPTPIKTLWLSCWSFFSPSILSIEPADRIILAEFLLGQAMTNIGYDVTQFFIKMSEE